MPIGKSCLNCGKMFWQPEFLMVEENMCPDCSKKVTQKKKFDDCLEMLMSVVNQACLMDDGKLDTLAISTYKEAIEFLVVNGKARWIKKGISAEWSEKP